MRGVTEPNGENRVNCRVSCLIRIVYGSIRFDTRFVITNSFGALNLHVSRVVAVVADWVTVGREFVVTFLVLSVLIVGSGVVVASLAIWVIQSVRVSIVAFAVAVVAIAIAIVTVVAVPVAVVSVAFIVVGTVGVGLPCRTDYVILW